MIGERQMCREVEGGAGRKLEEGEGVGDGGWSNEEQFGVGSGERQKVEYGEEYRRVRFEDRGGVGGKIEQEE